MKYKFILLITGLIMVISCKKNTSSTSPSTPVLTTTSISNATDTTANSGGNISNDGGASITARGVCWSTSVAPTITNSKTTNGTGSGTFSSSLTGLSFNTTYHVRAYATNSVGTSYGNEFTFTTSATVPVLTTTVTSSITATTAGSGGNISSDGGTGITARGVCWDTSASPTIANSKTTDSLGSGVFISSLTGLIPNTTYYVRAYATNSVGTTYGNQLNFTTSASIPVLTTTAINSITGTTAGTGGNVISDGGASVTVRGVCWSTVTNPTTANSKTTNGTGNGIFSSNLTGLSPNITYYFRAYATNSIGTSYGNEMSFTTLSSIPVLTTTAISAITGTTANSGGYITNDGGSGITARGVCWSTSASPTVANSKTTNGIGTGPFSSSLTGLNSSSTYHVRAYATNSAGTAYGNELIFTTSFVCGDNFTDIDGNVYTTKDYNGQCWMKENLKTTKYNDGSAIPSVTVVSQWGSLTTDAYCYYNNDAANNTYGKLYNWYAVNTGKLAPAGWHVPTDAEWTTLINYIGPGTAGVTMKSVTLWTNPGANTNTSGFTALPGGYRVDNGTFSGLSYYAFFWSADEFSTSNGLYRYLVDNYSNAYRSNDSKRDGFSIRCIKN